VFSDSIVRSVEGKTHRCVIKLKDTHYHLTIDTTGDSSEQAFAKAIAELVRVTSLNHKFVA